MSARLRIGLVVGVVAALAATVAVGAAVLQSEKHPALARTTATDGAPPLLLDLGLRRDDRTAALRRAAMLYDSGRRAEAGVIFRRHDSLNARVGSALARWPDGSVERLEKLARAHPRVALVHLNLGLALFWAGRRDEALVAWRAASRVEPDSVSSVRASDLLHPNSPRGLPTFVPSFQPPTQPARLSPARQLERLAGAARTGGVRARLLYGVALQRVGKPRSAERVYAAAAALDRTNVEAQVAAAVGRFTKERPERAFSRLGPLARRYPREPTVRFHLGLLLLWLGELEESKRQLALASATGERDPLAREADRFLRRLKGSETG